MTSEASSPETVLKIQLSIQPLRIKIIIHVPCLPLVFPPFLCPYIRHCLPFYLHEPELKRVSQSTLKYEKGGVVGANWRIIKPLKVPLLLDLLGALLLSRRTCSFTRRLLNYWSIKYSEGSLCHSIQHVVSLKRQIIFSLHS